MGDRKKMVETLSNRIKAIEKFIEENDQAWINSTDTYDEYSELRSYHDNQIELLGTLVRLWKEPKVLEDVDLENGDIMSIKDFIKGIECGMFTDFDGFGRYVKDGKEYDIKIYPSDFYHLTIREDFDQIAWYNK